MLSNFKGNILEREGKITLSINEGAAVVQETIDFLNSSYPIGELKWNDLIATASTYHTNDTGPKGLTGHDSSNGTNMSDRLKRYGKMVSTCGENISYGCSTGKEVVI